MSLTGGPVGAPPLGSRRWAAGSATPFRTIAVHSRCFFQPTLTASRLTPSVNRPPRCSRASAVGAHKEMGTKIYQTQERREQPRAGLNEPVVPELYSHWAEETQERAIDRHRFGDCPTGTSFLCVVTVEVKVGPILPLSPSPE
ncbi:hypothetical protein NDU88_007457 [Pleurodeles waltl]|uniref:Uncharacterized protein n=1 Tax=Pleurodeles waltl TaxID=8319 RepID=A0AAV7SSW5_PLEWA|nr:hypothetical protein NDU88_007457 [Pleurodeles waltl]